MEEERTDFCSNCKRDIPSVNYVMHAAHCKRNIVLCKVCQEPVAITQQEEHFEEYHAKVKCECGKQMERMNLEDHKESDCPNRIVTCGYCELELPFSGMKNHQEYCGSRTENCEKCNRYVKLKDMDLHLSSDCKLPEVPKPQITYPGEDDHQLNDENLRYRHLLALLTGMQDEWVGQHSFNDESPEMITNIKPLDEPNKQVPREPVVPRGLGTFSNIKTTNNEKEKNIVQKISHIPIFTNNVYSDNEEVSPQQNDDDDHLLAAYLANTFGEKTDGESETLPERAGPSDSPSGTFAEGFNTLEETCLPCEFCNNMYPASELILHQTGCGASMLPRHYPEYPELRSAPRSLPPLKNEPEARSLRSNSGTEMFTGPAGSSKEAEHTDEEPFLPCEFCNVLFPISSIVHHQVHCEMAPQSRPPSAARGFASKSIINPLPFLNISPQFSNVPSEETEEKANSETQDEEPPRINAQNNSANMKEARFRTNSNPLAQFGRRQNRFTSGIDSNINDDDFISAARYNRQTSSTESPVLFSKNQRQYRKTFSAEERPKAKPQESDDASFRSVLKNDRGPREVMNNQAISRDRGQRDERRIPSQNNEGKPNSSDSHRRYARHGRKKHDIHVGSTVNWSPVFQERKPSSNVRQVVSVGNGPGNPTGKSEYGQVPTRRKPKPTTNQDSQQRAGTRLPRETTRNQGGASVATKKSSSSRKKIV